MIAEQQQKYINVEAAATVIDQERTVKSAGRVRKLKNKCYPFLLSWGQFEHITCLRIKCFIRDSAVKAGQLSFQENFLDNIADLFLLDLVQSSFWGLAVLVHMGAMCLLEACDRGILLKLLPRAPRELQILCGCKTCHVCLYLQQGTDRMNLQSGSCLPLIHL